MWNLDEKKLQEMHDGFLNFQEVCIKPLYKSKSFDT